MSAVQQANEKKKIDNIMMMYMTACKKCWELGQKNDMAGARREWETLHRRYPQVAKMHEDVRLTAHPHFKTVHGSYVNVRDKLMENPNVACQQEFGKICGAAFKTSRVALAELLKAPEWTAQQQSQVSQHYGVLETMLRKLQEANFSEKHTNAPIFQQLGPALNLAAQMLAQVRSRRSAQQCKAEVASVQRALRFSASKNGPFGDAGNNVFAARAGAVLYCEAEVSQPVAPGATAVLAMEFKSGAMAGQRVTHSVKLEHGAERRVVLEIVGTADPKVTPPMKLTMQGRNSVFPSTLARLCDGATGPLACWFTVTVGGVSVAGARHGIAVNSGCKAALLKLATELKKASGEKEWYYDGYKESRQRELQASEAKNREGMAAVAAASSAASSSSAGSGHPPAWNGRIFFSSSNSSFSPGEPDLSFTAPLGDAVYGEIFFEANPMDAKFVLVASLLSKTVEHTFAWSKDQGDFGCQVVELVASETSLKFSLKNALLNIPFVEALIELASSASGVQDVRVQLVRDDAAKAQVASGAFRLDFAAGTANNGVAKLQRVLMLLKDPSVLTKKPDWGKNKSASSSSSRSSSSSSSGSRDRSSSRCSKWVTGTKVQAFVCDSCGSGGNKGSCVVCGKWCNHNVVAGILCDDHAFGSSKDNCARCGEWITGSYKSAAKVCDDCSFGSKKEECCSVR
jgi:hypothetical protein